MTIFPRCFPGVIPLFLAMVGVSGAFGRASQAQEIQSRLEIWRSRQELTAALRAQRGPGLSSRPLRLRPVWMARAQMEPPSSSTTAATTGAAATAGTTASPGTGDATTNSDSSSSGESLPAAVPFKSGRAISAYTDLSFGFDGQTAVIADPTPREVKIRRQIRVLNVALDYPLALRTSVALGVPLVSQTTHVRAGADSFTQKGNGLGDITFLVERRSAESKRGLETAVAVGLVVPTGQDPFNVGRLELPTGNGFYQPFVRLSVRKLRVPLQLFLAVNAGKAIPRTINGQRISLPLSYGGEAGFSYAVGSEFIVTSSISANRLSSPFLLNSGVNVAYLSQALSYRPGDDTSLRASVDVGLTDDSTDAYLGLSVNHTF